MTIHTLIMKTTTKTTIAVGERVEVRHYADYPGGPESWISGYTVRAVEWEDYSVERNGVAFVIGMNRVRKG